MRNFSSSIITRFVLVPALSFWIAGGCILGCGNMAAVAAEQNPDSAAASDQSVAVVVSGHACSTGGAAASSSEAGSVSARNTHSCCKKSSTEVKPKLQPPDARIATSIEFGASSSGMMTDCPLAGSKAAVVTKSRGHEMRAAEAVAQSFYPEPKSLEQPTRLSATPLIPNRGHTYLRCCAFLI